MVDLVCLVHLVSFVPPTGQKVKRNHLDVALHALRSMDAGGAFLRLAGLNIL